ncbi:MAG: glycosyltransferase family 39 protein [Bacilli bacterium]|nr:glycosyltransferase family 39 protein [Bacilli bacterium]
MDSILNFLSKMVIYIFLIVLSLVITLGNIDNGVVLSLLSIIFIFLFVNKINIKKFGIFIFVFSLIIKIAGILFLRVPVIADYDLMYNASLDVLRGDFSFSNNVYFSSFGYQIGNVLYQALVLKVFNSVFVLKALNCIYSSVITLLIYLLGRKIADDKSAKFISLFYTISLYPIYLNSVLGNQQLSLMLILLGVYIFLTKKNSFLNLVFVGILLALGNIERPEGIIYIASILIYVFLNKKICFKTIKVVALIFVVYFGVNFMANALVVKTGVSNVGLKNTNPYWKFVTGLNLESSGKYSSSDQDNYIHSKDLEKEIIVKRLTDLKRLPVLMYRKINVQWLYSDLGDAFNVKNNTQFSSSIIGIIINYIKCMNIFILLVALFGQLKNKMSDIEKFFVINFLLYFVAYLFIEVNARYYFNPQICILLLSVVGLKKLFDFYENKVVRHK